MYGDKIKDFERHWPFISRGYALTEKENHLLRVKTDMKGLDYKAMVQAFIAEASYRRLDHVESQNRCLVKNVKLQFSLLVELLDGQKELRELVTSMMQGSDGTSKDSVWPEAKYITDVEVTFAIHL